MLLGWCVVFTFEDGWVSGCVIARMCVLLDKSWSANGKSHIYLLGQRWWAGVRLVTFKNNQLRGIVSTQLAALVVNNLHITVQRQLATCTIW